MLIGILVYNSNAKIAEKILYSEEKAFAGTVAKLEEIQDNFYYTGINLSGLDMVIRIFDEFDVVNDRLYSWPVRSGNAVFIPDEQDFIRCYSPDDFSPKPTNIWQSWMVILRTLNEVIDEFFRYGHNDTNKDVAFLKDVLLFLSDMHVFPCVDKEKYE